MNEQRSHREERRCSGCGAVLSPRATRCSRCGRVQLPTGERPHAIRWSGWRFLLPAAALLLVVLLLAAVILLTAG